MKVVVDDPMLEDWTEFERGLSVSLDSLLR